MSEEGRGDEEEIGGREGRKEGKRQNSYLFGCRSAPCMHGRR